ncbi:MAG: hypothetical protein J6R68_06495 [Clostridia bacterium]|nr:hypothetical protein [Clostridia bacterium]
MNDLFVKTNEKVTITFNGWDGKSYNGETRTMNVYVNEFIPGKKFVKFYSRHFKVWTYHLIKEETHKVTGANLVSYWCSE